MLLWLFLLLGVDVVVAGTDLGLYVAIFVVTFGLKSINGLFGVLTPQVKHPLYVPLPCIAAECWHKLS